MGNNEYMPDPQGKLVPVELIKAQDLLEDETVRKILGYAVSLSDQIARFKQHTFDDLSGFEAILLQDYEIKRGGLKGNKTFMSFDGLFKVSVAVADFIDFGPQLQVAKELIDECLTEWSETARPEIRAVVTNAFNTDKEGKVNRTELFRLKKLDIEDARWKRGTDAINDAMKVVGSKTYVRCYRRDACDAPWRAVTIDLAKA
ncbi:DUF3164 family protein [Rhodobacteraceae bacterium M382]|nr:DUF3164 family protein [Rhodobacteraceae bacterium M382]